MMNARDLVEEERDHQERDLGYDLNHDITAHAQDDELVRAAACYADWAADEIVGTDDAGHHEPHVFWPWTDEDWKPRSRIEAMIKAAAMLEAQIDLELAALYGRDAVVRNPNRG